MIQCPAPKDMVEERIDRILTQYRESPNLLGVIRTLLEQAEAAAIAICSIPSFFDIETAVGDQLTLIGKRLGFPRCHCVCVLPPVFGFQCGDAYAGPYTIKGFCEVGSWINCRETGTSDVCIDDDEMYRGILMARRYQALGLFDADSLRAAARRVWGETASVSNLGRGRVVVAPGRALTGMEQLILPVAFRALPIAPGITALTSTAVGPVAGFGAGWAGFCSDTGEPEPQWLCPSDPHIYDCA